MTAATRSYTVEQVAAVQRVRACTTDAHYDVLGLTEASSVDEVKKAFKGVSLAGYLSVSRIVPRTSANRSILFLCSSQGSFIQIRTQHLVRRRLCNVRRLVFKASLLHLMSCGTRRCEQST